MKTRLFAFENFYLISRLQNRNGSLLRRLSNDG
jgi:hypothetical protein